MTHRRWRLRGIAGWMGLWLAGAFVFAVAGAGAAELPVLDWTPGSDWINVKDHGAVGDGQADDTAAIQRALDAMRDGSTVYFPAGVYRLGGEIRILKPKVEHTDGRYLGNNIYGHGRDTTLVWDGPDDGTMMRDMGMVHCRVIGLSFDGRGRAAYGINHDNDQKFETHLFYQFLAFRDFRECAFWLVPNDIDGQATAETMIRHSLFERCGVGLSLNSWNDYNFTVDGCHFADNRRGIHCNNGNFYVRNTRFERNELDIWAKPEHGISARRCVSIGSGGFLE